MAKCSVCGKGVSFGHNVSHSNRKTARTWKANIRKVNEKNMEKRVAQTVKNLPSMQETRFVFFF